MYTTSKNAIDRAGAAVVSTITSLKGSFNTSGLSVRFGQPRKFILNTKKGQFTFRVESFIDGKIDMQTKTVNWT